ncbi:hypothetical protein ABTC66_20545, partial [Acinetobacter baumannii]
QRHDRPLLLKDGMIVLSLLESVINQIRRAIAFYQNRLPDLFDWRIYRDLPRHLPAFVLALFASSELIWFD